MTGSRGTLIGSGVSSIRTGGSYCSIDEYSCRCDPQGTKGSGGEVIWDGSIGSGLGGIGMGANGNGFMRGGKLTGTSTGMTGGGGAVTGTDDGASGMMVSPSPVPNGLGLGMNIGVGDLLLNILL